MSIYGGKGRLYKTQSRLLTTRTQMPFKNIEGKEENADNQHFLLFPQCFLPFPNQISIFLSHFFLSSANAFNLDQYKILLFGIELTTWIHQSEVVLLSKYGKFVE